MGCYFTDQETGDQVLSTIEMPVPVIGSLVFVKGDGRAWRVEDIRYALIETNSGRHKLLHVEVVVRRVEL